MEQPAIEAKRLRPLILDYIENHEAEKGKVDNNGSTASQKSVMRGTYALASNSGLNVGVIQQIMGTRHVSYTTRKGERIFREVKWVGFTTADKIITHGLGNPFLWRTHFPDVIAQPIPHNAQDKAILERQQLELMA